MRTRLILASILVGAVLGAVEMIDEIIALPPFDYDHLGAFVATALNAMVVLRFRLLGSDWSARAVVYAAALGLLGLVGYLVAFRLLATQLALLLLTVATITLGLAAALRGTVRSAAERWQRERQLLFLGRFSAQMAHDLKNPLAALKGALDYLLEARARGAAAEDEQSFLQLMRQQTVRIEEVLQHYQRFGEQPRCESVDLRPLLEAVIAQASAKAPQIAVSREIDPALSRCWADPELIARACENIVANAIDAMPDGGRLTVRARATAIDAATPGVSIVFEDDGPGMDPRQLALACEEFHSSKGSSGLGLTFVQRVARDHGGELRLQSVLGRGTTAEIRLPGTEAQGRGHQ
jgi:signal transduction histidine kinase